MVSGLVIQAERTRQLVKRHEPPSVARGGENKEGKDGETEGATVSGPEGGAFRTEGA